MKRINWTSKGLNLWKSAVFVNEHNETVHILQVKNPATNFQMMTEKRILNSFPQNETSDQILKDLKKQLENSPDFVSTEGPRKLNLKHGEKYGEWKE